MPDNRTVPGADDTADAERADAAVPEERLLATCWSSAGDAASDRDDLRSPVPLRERIEAASAAGFRGFGLLSADLPAAEQEYGLRGIRAVLDDNGMVDLELEGIPRRDRLDLLTNLLSLHIATYYYRLGVVLSEEISRGVAAASI